MKKLILMLTSIACSATLNAQSWEVHIASGFSYARLIPAANSVPRSQFIRYGFSTPKLYLSPELDFKLNGNSRFSLGYQLSGNYVGLQFRPGSRAGAKEYSIDGITLHNFSVGYSYRQPVLKGKWQAGGFAKIGVAYGQMGAIGGGGSSGYLDNGVYYMGTERLTGFEVIPNFWAPVTTLGITTGPIAKGRRIKDRLTVNVAATMVWKNPYVAPSQTHYTMMTATAYREGIARFEGMPLQLQVGVDYSLFHFSRKAVSAN